MGLYRKGTSNYSDYDWEIANRLDPPSPIPQSSLTSSPTEFHGISYTLQDGTTEFVTPHPEVKEKVQRWLSINEVKIKEKELKDIEDRYPELNWLGRWKKIKSSGE